MSANQRIDCTARPPVSLLIPASKTGSGSRVLPAERSLLGMEFGALDVRAGNFYQIEAAQTFFLERKESRQKFELDAGFTRLKNMETG